MERRPAAPLPAEPRQRWRLYLRRDAASAALPQRGAAAALEAALGTGDLPLATGGRARTGIVFGAPLPLGVTAEREPVELLLTDRLPAWQVRERVARALPDGMTLVDLHDVWLGTSPLPGRVAAADYRIELDPDGCPPAGTLAAAAARLLAAAAIPRERAKGGGTVRYDLRPLLLDVQVEAGPPVVVRARTRFHPELGAGRPEEVVAALADQAGARLTAAGTVRERVLLAEDLEQAGASASRSGRSGD